jgi:hypothetical protein
VSTIRSHLSILKEKKREPITKSEKKISRQWQEITRGIKSRAGKFGNLYKKGRGIYRRLEIKRGNCKK